jgi:preprotein translocase subunit SecA
LFDISHVTLNHHINQALKAMFPCIWMWIMCPDGEILPLPIYPFDEGRRYSEGSAGDRSEEGLEIQNAA